MQQFSRDLQGGGTGAAGGNRQGVVRTARALADDVWAIAFGAGYIQAIDVHPGVSVARGTIPQYFALRPRFPYVAGTSSGSLPEIIAAVREWYDREQPNMSGGQWLVSLALCSGVDGQADRPLLELSLSSSLSAGEP
ncbi:MAG: hypothetical protein ACRD26_18965 [Vicinamibacterales bacterium]